MGNGVGGGGGGGAIELSSSTLRIAASGQVLANGGDGDGGSDGASGGGSGGAILCPDRRGTSRAIPGLTVTR